MEEATDPFTVTAALTSNDPNYASATVTSNLIINSPGTPTPTLSLTDGSAPYDGNAHAPGATVVPNYLQWPRQVWMVPCG
jgi:hypothetical protein